MCTSSDEGGIHHCFSLSGWIKIVESFAVFTLIMLHRIGAGVVNQMVRHQYKHSNCKEKNPEELLKSTTSSSNTYQLIKINFSKQYSDIFWSLRHDASQRGCSLSHRSRC